MRRGMHVYAREIRAFTVATGLCACGCAGVRCGGGKSIRTAGRDASRYARKFTTVRFKMSCIGLRSGGSSQAAKID